MDTRNEIKSYIVREGMTMADLVEKLAGQYGLTKLMVGARYPFFYIPFLYNLYSCAKIQLTKQNKTNYQFFQF